MLIALTVALAVVVGLALGLLGGGGSILMVPLLVYVAGKDAEEAIALSLVVVGVTSAVSVIGHARSRRVRWRTGWLLGATGIVGAFAGGLIGAHLPGQLLMGGFAVLMMVTAVAMLRGRRSAAPESAGPSPGCSLLIGAGLGLVTGLLGAGGGFLIVPALTLLAGLPMTAAVGTSLLVIAMNSAAGLAGHLTAVPVDWALTGAVTAAAVAGSLLGARLVDRIPADALRRAFGWFVLLTGASVLVQQAPDGARLPLVTALLGVAGVMGICSAFVPRCPLRHAEIVGPRTAGA
ncbi:hypothetical protein SAMN05660690_2960 [Geodermatophilus telluris]|uniref:Probable membrane transporter protein n=1 Tax=Geodermatophilus telluris TaxID=1190417 RepID=A0A1G6QJT9_9ACTN|nr:sulfite exporter TauE/SafE family protein [Geodermatophilus telluris]SDC92593.1 hypothetical protein SAMN05660690_2960 [Geodermatophilus telluris]